MSVPAAAGAPPSRAALETRTLERCLACGGARLLPLALRYEWEGTSFPLVSCRSCGMRFLGVQPAGAALERLYSAEYFQADYRCGRSQASSFDEGAFAAENRGLLDEFARLGAAGRLLEVGSASGWLLKHARERGWEVQGVEPSAEAAGFARAQGLEVFQGDLLAARLPAARFDLVYMGDVLEHVPDCRAVLNEVRRLLKPGGVLYLRGPITTHSLARSLALHAYGLLGRTLILREPPYHLWEFTPGPLRRLVGSAGLRVVELRQTKIPPGRPHGRKSRLQRFGMLLLDLVNLPLTSLLGVRGDRVVLIARQP